jgi:hypothetical protein
MTALVGLVLAMLPRVVSMAAPQQSDQSTGALAVALALTHTSAESGADLVVGGSTPQLTVVFRNVGTAPLRLWKDTCSWGYRNLSFEMSDAGGRRFTVSRVEVPWEKNVPTWDTLAPGASVSRDVTLNHGDWQGLPPLAPGEARRVSLRAVYRSSPDEQSRRHGIWVGSAQSEDLEVTLTNQRG